MWLFLLLCIPFCYICIIRIHKHAALPEGNFLFLLGSIAAVLYGIIDFLLIKRIYIPAYSFLYQFLFIYLTDCLVPCIIILGIINLFTKGIVSYRLRTAPSILFGFFTIFLPYRIIAVYPVFTLMQSLVAPVLYVSFLFYLDSLVSLLYNSIIQKKALGIQVYLSVILFLLTLIPAIIETIWKLHMAQWLWITLSCLYSVFAFVLWKCIHKGEGQ